MITVIGLLTNAIDAFLLSVIVTRLNSDKKISLIRYVLFFIVFAICPFLVKTIIRLNELSLFLNIILMFCIVVCFFGWKKDNMLSLLIWFIFSLLSEFLVFLITLILPNVDTLTVLYNDNIMTLAMGLLSKIFQSVLVFAFAYIWKRKKTKTPRKFSPSQVILFGITFLLVVCIIFTYYWSLEGVPMPESFLVFFTLCIAAFLIASQLIINRIIKFAQEKEDIAKLEMQKVHYERMQSAIDEYRELQHNYVHHLQVIHNLLDERNYDKANEYFADIELEFKEATPTLILNQPVLSSIILQKQQYAAKQQIEFLVNIPSALNTDVKETDLCVIISNLLDNAFEACVKTEKKYTKASVDIAKELIYIKIINTSPPRVSSGSGFWRSTKPEPILHGFGLRSVKRLVDRYDGELHLEYENIKDEFQARVILPTRIDGLEHA